MSDSHVEKVIERLTRERDEARSDRDRLAGLLADAVDHESAIVDAATRSATPEGTPIPTPTDRDIMRRWVEKVRAALAAPPSGAPAAPLPPEDGPRHECPSCDFDDTIKVPPGKLLASTPIKRPLVAPPPELPDGICLWCKGFKKIVRDYQEERGLVAYTYDCPRCVLTPPEPPAEPLYPCADCGKLRTKAEGGTTFTVCDECWDKHYSKSAPPEPPDLDPATIEACAREVDRALASSLDSDPAGAWLRTVRARLRSLGRASQERKG